MLPFVDADTVSVIGAAITVEEPFGAAFACPPSLHHVFPQLQPPIIQTCHLCG